MNEKPNTAVVPYLPTSTASPDPVALANEFSSGYVNKTIDSASKISSAIGMTDALKQTGLNKYSDQLTPDTVKNLLSALAIMMLMGKFKETGYPWLKKNWKPVGAGAIAIAYLLYQAKQKQARTPVVANEQMTGTRLTSFGVRG